MILESPFKGQKIRVGVGDFPHCSSQRRRSSTTFFFFRTFLLDHLLVLDFFFLLGGDVVHAYAVTLCPCRFVLELDGIAVRVGVGAVEEDGDLGERGEEPSLLHHRCPC